MNETNLIYNGDTIATMSKAGTKVLNTKGTCCESNIRISTNYKSAISEAAVTGGGSQSTTITFSGVTHEPIALFIRQSATVTYASTAGRYYILSVQKNESGTISSSVIRIDSNYKFNLLSGGSGFNITYDATAQTLKVVSSGSVSASPGVFSAAKYQLTYLY